MCKYGKFVLHPYDKLTNKECILYQIFILSPFSFSASFFFLIHFSNFWFIFYQAVAGIVSTHECNGLTIISNYLVQVYYCIFCRCISSDLIIICILMGDINSENVPRGIKCMILLLLIFNYNKNLSLLKVDAILTLKFSKSL